MKKRIFYFNVTYTCNSQCLFCYSHNTKKGGEAYRQLSLSDFRKYIIKYSVGLNDRVILNGGEPLLHTEINSIFDFLKEIGCEVLIYSNGRVLDRFKNYEFTNNFRFIIPIHGDECIHDRVTRCLGSYHQTMAGLDMIKSGRRKCSIDIKVIINNLMLVDSEIWSSCMNSFKRILPYNNGSVHITKMADTVVSKQNAMKSVNNVDAGRKTAELYELFHNKNITIKLYDTCIRGITDIENCRLSSEDYESVIEVFGKDYLHEEKIYLNARAEMCNEKVCCKFSKACISAVDSYLVLKRSKTNFEIDLE